jgi:hypothetical protein
VCIDWKCGIAAREKHDAACGLHPDALEMHEIIYPFIQWHTADMIEIVFSPFGINFFEYRLYAGRFLVGEPPLADRISNRLSPGLGDLFPCWELASERFERGT